MCAENKTISADGSKIVVYLKGVQLWMLRKAIG